MIMFWPRILFAPEGSGSGGGGDGGSSAAPSAPAGGGGSASPSSAPSGASPTPEAPPAPAPSLGGAAEPVAPPESTPGDGSLFDFGPMLSEQEGDDDDSPPQPTAQPEPPKAAQPPAPTGAEPAAQPPAEPVKVEPAPTPPGPQEPSPQSAPTEPLAIAAALLKEESAIVDHLAESEFKLSQQDLEALESDAPAHIPKLLARAYLKSSVNFLNQMGRLVPQMIQSQMQIMRQNMDNENRFYSRWPDIDKVKHAPLVKKFGTVYRQANPQASMEQMIEELGPMIMSLAKIQPKAQPSGNGVGTPRPPQPTPFVPAMGGPAAPPAQQTEDMWAGMGQSPADED